MPLNAPLTVGCTSWWARAAALMGALLVPLVLASCLPPNAEYDLGLGTNRVSGSVRLGLPEENTGEILVLALKYHHTFIAYEGQGSRTRPSAHVIPTDEHGNFSISMPSDVVALEVFFAAPGHITDTFRFQRQIGVGNVRYQASLPHTPDWRHHYYTFVNPQFQHFIVETRYALAPHEETRLAEWLAKQNELLNK